VQLLLTFSLISSISFSTFSSNYISSRNLLICHFSNGQISNIYSFGRYSFSQITLSKCLHVFAGRTVIFYNFIKILHHIVQRNIFQPEDIALLLYLNITCQLLYKSWQVVISVYIVISYYYSYLFNPPI